MSDAGDILYVLPSNFKQVIAGKSWLLRAEPFLQKVRDASAYLVRVTFGTALITSVVLVWLTILAILSSSNRDDDRRLVHLLLLHTCLPDVPVRCWFVHDTYCSCTLLLHIQFLLCLSLEEIVRICHSPGTPEGFCCILNTVSSSRCANLSCSSVSLCVWSAQLCAGLWHFCLQSQACVPQSA